MDETYAWPMPGDTTRHKEAAEDHLVAAEVYASKLPDGAPRLQALLQVALTSAQVSATLAAGAAELQAAALLAEAGEAADEDEAAHACPSCRESALALVQDAIANYLHATEGISSDNDETAKDMTAVVRRVLFGVAAPPGLPPAAYREQEG